VGGGRALLMGRPFLWTLDFGLGTCTGTVAGMWTLDHNLLLLRIRNRQFPFSFFFVFFIVIIIISLSSFVSWCS
jgi:hypothetical protein